jgi:ribonuclease HII
MTILSRCARPEPDYAAELAAMNTHGLPVAGIDEAGRGPWAGPVVAAAVVLDSAAIPDGIRDSKMLSPDQRARLCQDLYRAAIAIGVGLSHPDEIDRVNILQATWLAMQRAVAALRIPPRVVLIDGNRAPRMPCAAETFVGGDARCLSIAAASIVAKVARDSMMIDLSNAWPGYGFERHKGYGTAVHRAALLRLGVTPVHRRSFRPVRDCLDEAAGRSVAGPHRDEPVSVRVLD